MGPEGRKGPGLPYKGMNPLLTTLTTCRVCGCVVAHLDQRLHDQAVHPPQAPPDLVEQYDDPALAS